MKKVIFVLLVSLFPLMGFSQKFPEKPNPPRLVNDYTKTLSAGELNALESKLLAYNDSTSTQIAIVMISSLDGYPIDDYSIQLAEKWGIGRKGKDNGVLIFVAKDDRKIFIPTGYGMEGVLTDGLVKRIIENDIKPSFRAGNYYEGFDKATTTMFKLASGEYTGDGTSGAEKPPVSVFFVFFFVLFIFGIIIYSQVRSVRNYAALNSIPFWTAWMLLNQARNRHRGHWGGFTGGGGFGGGSSGGGFGGFGGGSFGGGGAGGSW